MVLMVELTVPWEEGMEAAFERKKEKYTKQAAVCSQAGWRAVIYPGEVGCQGYTVTSMQRFLRFPGITGTELRKVLKDLAEEAKQRSFLLWF